MRASIDVVLSVIHAIVAKLHFKRLNDPVAVEINQAKGKANASNRMKTGRASFRSEQSFGTLVSRRRLSQGFRKAGIRLLLGLLVVPMVVLWSYERVARVDTSQGAIPTGAGPQALAVNPATNKIYVANYGSNTVTVIDGSNNTTSTVMAGSHPFAIAVNPATNKIYVANNGSSNVTVID